MSETSPFDSNDSTIVGPIGTLIVADRGGEERQIEGYDGLSIMEVIKSSGEGEMLALCGGCCSCATCHVYVDKVFWTRLPTMGSDENDLLDGSSYRSENSRLACQIPFTAELNGLRVTIAPED